MTAPRDFSRAGVIGVGVVGGALARYLESIQIEVVLYDRFKDVARPLLQPGVSA
jgi:phosphoglycerate dehydrogenase-like enzyme